MNFVHDKWSGLVSIEMIRTTVFKIPLSIANTYTLYVMLYHFLRAEWDL